MCLGMGSGQVCGNAQVTWRAVLVNEAVERDEVLGVKG